MKPTYEIDLTPKGIGTKALLLLAAAMILQLIIYLLFGFVCFVIGIFMFIVGGIFGRMVQHHYQQNTQSNMVRISVPQQHHVWYRKLLITLFPVWGIMVGLSSNSFSELTGFCCLHICGGKNIDADCD